jgi:hypothetical protein
VVSFLLAFPPIHYTCLTVRNTSREIKEEKNGKRNEGITPNKLKKMKGVKIQARG